MGTLSTNESGPSLVCFLGLSCGYKRFLVCFGCSSRQSTKTFFPHRPLFQCLCPHRPASWAGSHAGSPVSSYVSLTGTQWRCKGAGVGFTRTYSWRRNLVKNLLLLDQSSPTRNGPKPHYPVPWGLQSCKFREGVESLRKHFIWGSNKRRPE